MRKLKQKLQSKETKKAKEAASVAVTVLQKALDVFKDVAGNLGVPGLEAGVGVVSTVLQMIQVRVTCNIPGTDAHAVARTREETLRPLAIWRRS